MIRLFAAILFGATFYRHVFRQGELAAHVLRDRETAAYHDGVEDGEADYDFDLPEYGIPGENPIDPEDDGTRH